MEILKLIEAHFINDDEAFNNYARAIVDYYKKDGNLEGADEILELIKTGHIPIRTNTPLLYKEPEHTKAVYSSKSQDTVTSIQETDDIKDDTNEPVTVNEQPKKRHRRTKAEIEADNKAKENSNQEIDTKPKRHSRTKAEMEADRLKAEELPADTKKRHRRTKEELINAGYYDKKEDEDTSTKKRHRRTKS